MNVNKYINLLNNILIRQISKFQQNSNEQN